MDLGSVSTGYSDRPVARAIKIKHAGLNLTGPALRRRVSSAIALELVRRKLQAASFKLDNRSGIV